jgi:hypothetical protein
MRLSSGGWFLAEFGWDLAGWLERLTANAEGATVLGSIPASSDAVESKGRQMKQCWIQNVEEKKALCFTGYLFCCLSCWKPGQACWLKAPRAESCLEFLPIPQIAYFIGYYPLCIYTQTAPFTASHKLSTTNAHFLLNCNVYSAGYLSPVASNIHILHRATIYLFFPLRIFWLYFLYIFIW